MAASAPRTQRGGGVRSHPEAQGPAAISVRDDQGVGERGRKPRRTRATSAIDPGFRLTPRPANVVDADLKPGSSILDPAVHPVGAVQPLHHLDGHRMIHRLVAPQQALAIFAQVIDALILKGMQVVLEHGR